MIQKSLGSTSVIRHNYNKACVQACVVNSYSYQQHKNHLSTRSEQCCFQACRRYMRRSGYLYKVSILWSKYWHWENLVIRDEWMFFVCKQIAYWFIRDAPLRTNCSRCCLCSQWLKGPTWISFNRSELHLTQSFPGQECCWQGLQSTEPGGCSSITQPSPGAPLAGTGFRRGCSCCHLVQGWPRSGLQPCSAPHSTTRMNPPILQTLDLHYEYPGSGKPHFPAMRTHMPRD